MHVENKVAIITGASSGLGKALAERLVSKGAKVILGDIDIKDGLPLFTAAKTHFGRVDIIANNAGIAENAPLWEDEKGVWKKVIDIDLSAVVEGTRLGIEALKKQ
ncbi:hypothetical protein BGZ88_008504, partial [Linnemannia elongata]